MARKKSNSKETPPVPTTPKRKKGSITAVSPTATKTAKFSADHSPTKRRGDSAIITSDSTSSTDEDINNESDDGSDGGNGGKESTSHASSGSDSSQVSRPEGYEVARLLRSPFTSNMLSGSPLMPVSVDEHNNSDESDFESVLKDLENDDVLTGHSANVYQTISGSIVQNRIKASVVASFGIDERIKKGYQRTSVFYAAILSDFYSAIHHNVDRDKKKWGFNCYILNFKNNIITPDDQPEGAPKDTVINLKLNNPNKSLIVYHENNSLEYPQKVEQRVQTFHPKHLYLIAHNENSYLKNYFIYFQGCSFFEFTCVRRQGAHSFFIGQMKCRSKHSSSHFQVTGFLNTLNSHFFNGQSLVYFDDVAENRDSYQMQLRELFLNPLAIFDCIVDVNQNNINMVAMFPAFKVMNEDKSLDDRCSKVRSILQEMDRAKRQ